MKKWTALLLAVVFCATMFPLGAFASLDRWSVGSKEVCSLSFDANGGVNAPDAAVAVVDSYVALPKAEPEKDGMSFMGWATSLENANSGVIAYSAGDTVKLEGDTRLYASFAYDVYLNHGPEGWGTEAYLLHKYPDVPLDLCHHKDTIHATYAMLPGVQGSVGDQRMFIEWNTELNANSKGVGDSYHEQYTANESTTLYAVWGFSIRYNADGGVFPATGTDVFDKYVANYDGSWYQNPKTMYGNFDLPEGEYAPYKEGCRLGTMSDGRVYYILLYSDMRPCTTETRRENLTIPPFSNSGLNWSYFHSVVNAIGEPALEYYASWEPGVHYYANGGVGDDVVEYLSYNWGSLYNYKDYTIMTAKDAKAKFSRPGCEFIGWNTKPNGTGQSYAPGTVINYLGNSDPIYLYAQWKGTPTSYVISFDANGGKITSGNGSYSATPGQTYASIIGSAPVAVREGYTFAGWKCGSYTLNLNDTFTASSDMTFTAQWVSNAHTISFDANGGDITSGQSSYSGYRGQTFAQIMGSAPVAQRTGYTFAGWKCGDYDLVMNDPFSVDYDVTFVAQWVANGYIISFDPLGGALVSGQSSYVGAPGQTFTEIMGDMPVAVKAGYRLVGWQFVDYMLNMTDTYAVHANMVFHAVWEVATYTVTFDANGGTNAPAAQTKTHDIGLPISMTIPVREGYEFRGWATTPAASVAEYTPGAVYTANSDVTLYAVWQKIEDPEPPVVEPTTPEVTVSGVSIKVSGLEGAKDFFIANGTVSTYSEVKANLIVRVTTAKFGDAGEYTYPVGKPGDFTVYIRFDDPSKSDMVIYATIDGILPEIVVNGLQVYIYNLDGIRVIRSAPGVHSTAGQVKRAEGCRGFSGKALAGYDPYMIQYSENGDYTLVVEYTNGMCIVETVTIKNKAPSITQDGNKVILTDLDDMYVIRYAPGIYTTPTDVKKAPGALAIQPAGVSGGKVTVTLKPGVYTFMIQYNDNSKNFYTITVE